MEGHPTIENIFKPGSGHGGGEGGLASALPLLLADRSRAHDAYGGGWGGFGGGGFGAGLVGGILGGLLFNRRGLFDGGDCHPHGGRSGSDIALDAAILSGVNGLTAAVPTTALETQNALQNGLAQLALGTQQGLANVKDTVQNAAAVQISATTGVKDSVQQSFALLSEALCGVNQNVSAQGCMTREAVSNDGDKTRALLQARFQLEDATQINKLNAEVVELRAEGRRHSDNAELKLAITNTNTAVATAQQQQQQQQQQEILHGIRSLFPLLSDITQVSRSTNANVIAGNSGAVATGPQTSNPTQVGRI